MKLENGSVIEVLFAIEVLAHICVLPVDPSDTLPIRYDN